MTQEEKAKAYDEAIENMRKFRNALNNHEETDLWVSRKDIVTDIEYYFPELKESEDERIRRNIIAALKGEGYYDCDLTNECIAWVEKQGSSSVKWQKNTPDNKPTIRHSVLMKTTQGIAEGEWQGEYWFQYRWSWTLKDSDVLAWMELSDLDEQGEQKPAWSDEDEHRVEDTIYYLDTAKKHYASTIELDACIDWLKSLKQRYTWKPSEEQMQVF